MHLIFTPMHSIGISGMPRRYYDYPEVYASGNGVATSGTLGISILVVVWM